MKKSELKRVLRPIVEELVEDYLEEKLLEEGFFRDKIEELVLEGSLVKGLVKQVATGLLESTSHTPAQVTTQVHSPTPVHTPSSLREKLGLPTHSRPQAPEVLSPQIEKLKNGEMGNMFEGTVPTIPDELKGLGGPNDLSGKLAEAAYNPDLGPPVSEDVINAIMGGKKYNFKE